MNERVRLDSHQFNGIVVGHLLIFVIDVHGFTFFSWIPLCLPCKGLFFDTTFDICLFSCDGLPAPLLG